MNRVIVAGTASGVGKTTVATGLMAALRRAGHTVAGFKVGPDFIDPGYHAAATGRPPRNLDPFLSGEELIAPLFMHGAAGADIAVVEGVMGLFDGASGRGSFASTAHVATLLQAPVVLVVDASSMARSIAAMVHGYATFDPDVRVAGVIANRVGSARHVQLLHDALQPLGIPLIGALRRDDAMATPSRHLGLIPVAERRAAAARTVGALAETLTAGVDLHAVTRIAASAPTLRARAWQAPQLDSSRRLVAVARGPAFTFAYTENLELLAGAGADLAAFDPTTDALPDGAAAVYLGGGFPEEHAGALASNEPLRRQIAEFRGPVLAECGGLLYLCRSLDGAPMCGVVDADARMTSRLTLGYREAEAVSDSVGWQAGDKVRGHEFHRTVVEPDAGAAWQLDGTRREGFVAGRVHASYLHTHWARTPDVARRFLWAAA
jgi:cobyrinic acid a,c-diamide synthase